MQRSGNNTISPSTLCSTGDSLLLVWVWQWVTAQSRCNTRLLALSHRWAAAACRTRLARRYCSLTCRVQATKIPCLRGMVDVWISAGHFLASAARVRTAGLFRQTPKSCIHSYDPTCEWSHLSPIGPHQMRDQQTLAQPAVRPPAISTLHLSHTLMRDRPTAFPDPSHNHCRDAASCIQGPADRQMCSAANQLKIPHLSLPRQVFPRRAQETCPLGFIYLPAATHAPALLEQLNPAAFAVTMA